MATWTSKYGTVINIPDGLTAKQINEIKTLANSRYGTKAQQLATQYGSQVKSGTGTTDTSTAATVVQPVQPVNLGMNTNGTVNGPVAAGTIAGSEKQDVINTQLGQNANITDGLGNTQTVTVDPTTGQATVTQGLGAAGTAASNFVQSALGATTPGQVDLSGAPQIMDASGLQGLWDKSQQSLYGLYTKNLDRNQDRALEAQKQELANRGFVYNPGDPNSGYGKAIGAINEDYASQKDSALDRSIAGATAQMQANAGVNSDAYSKFVDTAFRQANNPLAQAATGAQILGSVSGQMPTFQGTSSDTSSQLLALDELYQRGQISLQDYNLKKQALAKQGSGTSSNSGFSIGGFAP